MKSPKSNKLLVIFLAALVLFCIIQLPISAHAAGDSPDSNGADGSENKPYIVNEESDFSFVLTHMSSHFLQTADITLTGARTPIGNPSTPFQGKYNGNGYKIANLTINDGNLNYAAMFGYTSGATIRNVTLTDVNISGGQNINQAYVAGIVAMNTNNSVIERCRVTSGTITGATNDWTGGIAGGNGGVIRYCSNSAAIQSGSFDSGSKPCTGGIAGGNYATIEDCYNTGTVTVGDIAAAGGIVGFGYSNSVVRCYSTGSISVGTIGSCAGAIVGRILSSESLSDNYYLTGSAASGIGDLDPNNEYYDANVASDDGCTPASSGSLQNPATYTNWSIPNNVWTVVDGVNNRYPVLKQVPAMEATAAASAITITTASSGGNVIGDGYGTVSGRGVQYCKGTDPISTAAAASGGTGIYSVALSGLTPATQYYTKAYATNEAGTAYGEPVLFSTLPTAPGLSVTVVQGSAIGTTKAVISDAAASKFVVNITDSSAGYVSATDDAPAAGAYFVDNYIPGSDISNGVAVGKYLSIYDVGSDGKVVKFFEIQLTELHIRNAPLSLPIIESFENGGILAGWGKEVLTESPEGYKVDWTVQSNDPESGLTVLPHTGDYMAMTNFYSAGTGSTGRLSLIGDFSLEEGLTYELSFYMFHSTELFDDTIGVGDAIQPQISLDSGVTWLNLGEPILRTSAAGWVKHTRSLDSYAGNSTVRIGFLAVSDYGYSTFIDDIVVEGASLEVSSAVLAPDNSYMDITFTKGVYGAADGMTALAADKLSLTFAQNGGTASNAVIDSIKKTDGTTALSGGETTVRVFLSISGTPSGVETVEIKPAGTSSIYGQSGNAMAATETTGVKVLRDQEAPTVGGGGIIAAVEGATTIDLAWSEAADTLTAQENLQYKIVISGTNNIETVENAESNGTIVQDWIADIGSFQVTGLARGTSYYLNIMVRDEAGNRAIYNTASATTTIPEISITGNSTAIANGDTTPDSLDGTDFGSADIKTGTVERTFTIQNTGTGELSLTGTPRVEILGAAASDFTVSQEPSAAVAAGESTAFKIIFDPAAEGAKTAVVSIANNDSDENPYSFNISGMATAAPEISIKGKGNDIANGSTTPQPTNGTDYGSADIQGGTVTRTYVIDNLGSAAIILSGTPKIAISGAAAADFAVTQEPAGVIEADGSTSFIITFDPSAEGARTATISIASNDSDENPYSFNIVGMGSVSPEINIKGNGISIVNGDVTPGHSDDTDYGNADISGGTITKEYTIENLGSGILALDGTPKVEISGADAADFAVTTQPSSPIMGGEGTTFRVTFDPSRTGNRMAVISIMNNDGDENPYIFSIRGTGIDNTAPTAGAGGAITVSSTTANSISLLWTAATDDGTAREDLQYLVVYSDTGNIDTVADAVYNGAIIAGWAADITTAEASGLTAETTYYFNVIVKDQEGNEEVYDMISATTAEATDTVAPTAGGSGAITLDNITASSVDLSWEAASDNKTARENLKYKVVYSQNNDINNVSEAINNGTEVQGWEANLTGLTTGGLNPDTLYYFNVIAADEAGNKTVYQAVYERTLEAEDNTKPVAGAGGAIIIGNVTTSSIELNWEAASDNKTAGENLQYKVVYSGSNNISTVNDALSNGTTAQAWSRGLTRLTVTGLESDTVYYFNIIVTDEAGNKSAYQPVSQATKAKPSPDDKNDERRDTATDNNSTPSTAGAITEVVVNGQVHNAGTTTVSTEADKTITTVAVDGQKIEEKLQQEGNGAKVVIPVSNTSDVVAGVLNGQTIKSMEQKEAILEIRTETVSYVVPASAINIDNISVQLGQQTALKDIKVSITVAEPSADTVKIVEDAADKGSYQIVVKPVEFEISCTSGDKTVKVNKFDGYVERTLAIPEGIDPTKITTGVVLNSDGTFSHVPTSIVVIDGKYYAKISSLTNSTYSVIWNPKAFRDVENHWAKEAVNDMGSRLVINGVDEDSFAPDREITRGEFASIIVKGLGLMRPGTGKYVYSDVNKTEWYFDAVYIANEYGLINGTGNGKFEPDRKITREEAMLIIARAMAVAKLDNRLSGMETEKLLESYEDSFEIDDRAEEAVAVCIKYGIVQGDGWRIKAADNITRAEAATAVRRLLQKAKLI